MNANEYLQEKMNEMPAEQRHAFALFFLGWTATCMNTAEAQEVVRQFKESFADAEDTISETLYPRHYIRDTISAKIVYPKHYIQKEVAI